METSRDFIHQAKSKFGGDFCAAWTVDAYEVYSLAIFHRLVREELELFFPPYEKLNILNLTHDRVCQTVADLFLRALLETGTAKVKN